MRLPRRGVSAKSRKLPLKVCVLSPHPFVLEEVERLLGRPGFRLQTRRLESALAPDLRRLAVPRAGVYVVDAHLSRPAIEAVVAGVLGRVPAARLVVLSERLSDASALALLHLGVKGLLTYAEARRQLPRAVRAVAGGGLWAPRALLSRFVDSVSTRRRPGKLRSAAMSGREQEVLDGLLANLSNKEIAARLNISERTVKFHVSNVLAKFGVERRQQLILHCLAVRPAL